MRELRTEDGRGSAEACDVLSVCGSDARYRAKEELGHPPTVYLREDQLADGLNEWIAGLFSPQNLDETVAILVGAQGKEDAVDAAEQSFRGRIAAAEATMGRLQRALEAGWDPEALTGQYNAAVAEKKAALAGLEALKPAERLSASDIRAMVKELGAMKAVLDRADRGDLADLYGALGLEVSYNHKRGG